MIGQTISHYSVVDKLGEGGMGVVYRAEDTKLRRTVALKFLARHLTADGDEKERFTREAQAAAALDHPNICTIHEIDEQDGQVFISMALIDGAPLNRLIEQGPMAVGKALEIAIQICQGLREAHGKGVVHRDIKPANIMVVEKGVAETQVKLMDFGLAQLSGRSKITRPNTVLGTIAYMSPEQTQGVPTDHRADLWALGVVLYEMATGRRPFEGDYDQAVMFSILNEDPAPLTSVRTGIPVDLEWVVAKALAKSPDERYQSANDMIVDLRAQLRRLESGTSLMASRVQIPPATPRQGTQVSQGPPTAGPGGAVPKGASGPTVDSGEAVSAPSRSRAARIWQAAFFTLLAIVLVASAVFGLRRSQVPAPEVRRFTLNPEGYAQTAMISPDGGHLAYVVSKGRSTAVLLHDFESGLSQEITQSGGSRSLAWSPDGDWLAFHSGDQLKKLDVQRGDVVNLAGLPSPFVAGVSWEPSGDALVFSSGLPPKIFRVPAQGGRPEELRVGPTQEDGDKTFVTPLLLPGRNQRALVYASDVRGPMPRLYYWDAEASESRVLTPGVFPSYARSGHLVYQRGLQFSLRSGVRAGEGIWAMPFSVGSGQPAGEPFLLAANGSWPSVSSDGTLAYLETPESEGGQLVWRDREGRKLSEVGQPQEDIFLPRLSPDGSKVAVEAVDAGGSEDIWMHDLQRALKTRFTLTEGTDARPIWTHDGRQIAYWSEGEDRPGIYLQSSEGGAEIVPVGSGLPLDYPSDWSPDGQYLLFVRGEGDAFGPGRRDGGGGAPRGRPADRPRPKDGQPPRARSGGAAEPPGGRPKSKRVPRRLRDSGPLAPGGDESEGRGIWYLERTPTGWQEKPFLASSFVEAAPRFSPDGRFVAYCSDESGVVEVYVRSFPDAGNKVRVSRNGGSQPVWSRDGSELYFVEEDTLLAAAIESRSRKNLTVGQPIPLFTDPTLLWRFHQPSYDVSPDGRRFLMTEPIGGVREPVIRIVQNWWAEFVDR